MSDSKKDNVNISAVASNSTGNDHLSLVQFFYMEFFGAFVPGVAAVGSTMAIFSYAAKFYGYVDLPFMNTVIDFGFRPYGFALLLFISHVIGTIVYRRPHEAPDMASCLRLAVKRYYERPNYTGNDFEMEISDPRPKLLKKLQCIYTRLRIRESLSTAQKASANDSWIKDFTFLGHLLYLFDYIFRPDRAWFWMRRSLSSNGNPQADREKSLRSECPFEYPYTHYKASLFAKNAGNIAKYIPWCGASPNQEFRHTGGKVFINGLKQKIRALAPSELVRDMIRNEAHSRLLSSLWYILRFLIFFMFAINCVFFCVHIVKTAKESTICETRSSRFEIAVGFDQSTSSTRTSDGRTVRSRTFSFKRTFNPFRSRSVEIGTKGSPDRDWWKYISISSIASFLLLNLKYLTESGFHYVRVRELDMILETVNILQEKRKSEGKDGPFDEYVKNGEKVCKEANCQNCRGSIPLTNRNGSSQK